MDSVTLSPGQQDSHSFFQNFKRGGVFLPRHSFTQRAECIDVKHGETSSFTLPMKRPILVFKSEQVGLVFRKG